MGGAQAFPLTNPTRSPPPDPVGRMESSAQLRDFDRFLERVDTLLRWRHVFLTGAAFAFALQYARGRQTDWKFFYDGSRLLFNTHPFNVAVPGGLHLYANFPSYQIGPLSLLVTVPFRWM